MNNIEKIEALENEGMLDFMTHQLIRFKAVNAIAINQYALWQRFIRS